MSVHMLTERRSPVLSARELLHLWEWGQGQLPVQQALMILSAVYPEVPLAQLSELSIGRRDAHLLAVRSHTFGEQMQATTYCPQCAEALEYSLNVRDLTELPQNLSAKDLPAVASDSPVLYRWQEGEYAVSFRLPNSADVLAVIQAEPERAQKALFQRCCVSASYQEQAIAPETLPDTLSDDQLQSLSDHMAKQDPQAEIRLNLRCQSCGHQWSVLFDITAFLWKEIVTAAHRLLQEIHLLAAVYSWREADILDMSTQRRQAYISQISEQMGHSFGPPTTARAMSLPQGGR
ncbi:MAG: phage baseplate protein [Cyanobacteria bacterium J06623_4]